MNDSFSQLAKRIRQDKINKKEIKKIKREIIDDKVLKIIKNDMALRIQKCIRGYLYRKKYYSFLEQINTETIIDYLYDKKIKRIQTDYKNIIAHHISNYIINIREEKEKVNKNKIHSIDLIKAYLKGMIFRKHFSREISSLEDIKDKIERYILGYKIRLILRSNNIQSLLVDIANIKYSLNDLDKTNDGNNQKLKELKTKLTKNINLFYFTFYQMKENSNWISQTKINDPWIQKYMSIINKDKENENDKNNGNIFVKKQSIYSNQKKIRRLKQNNSKNDNKKEALKNIDNNTSSKNNISLYDKDNNIDNEKEIQNIEKKENKENIDSLNNKSDNDNNNINKSDKKYDFNFYDSESDDLNDNVNRKILHKGTDIFENKKSKNQITIKKTKTKTLNDDEDLIENEYNNDEKDKKVRNNIVQRYKSKKSEGEPKLATKKSKSFEDIEIKNNNEKEIDDYNDEEDNLNKRSENKERNNSMDNNMVLEKEIINEKKPKKLNKYQQREERPIKPLKNINFLENENPFGLKRESSENISEINENLSLNPKKPIEKRIINSTRAINRAMISYNQKGKNNKQNTSEMEKEETIKTQEKTDLSHEELPVSNKYIEYDNRPCGGGAKKNGLYDFSKYEEPPAQDKLDRNERPLVGAKKIDYNAMFGDDGQEFEGDPFGGAKQYESNNKDRVKNVNLHKSNTIKKKPVYDARKAIEEAKLKEAKEGKKEKPSAFREFLREMKKISAEEKAQHNETNTDNNNNKNEKKAKNKNKKNDIKDNNNNLELKTEANISSDKNIQKVNKEERMPKRVSRKKDKKINQNTEMEDKNEINNDNNIALEDKENTLKRKHRGSVAAAKGSETNALRKKLHELEKAPAPVLNIKGIKSRIECWGNNNDNKKGKINPSNVKPKETPKSRDEKKSKINNKGNDQQLISNFINNKKAKEQSEANNNNTNTNNMSLSTNNITKISKNMEEKIEKYVDKKLMQLSVQIEEIGELFNFDNYFKEKEDKMKQYINLPYIKQSYDFVVNYTDEDYDEKMNEIEKIYKELK